MNKLMYDVLLIAVVALVTFATRALPFLVFPENKKAPVFITYLSHVLPCAVMGMLVIYCLKNINILSSPYGLPEIISVALVTVLHLWKRNTMVSIIAGTITYMLLIQFVFI